MLYITFLPKVNSHSWSDLQRRARVGDQLSQDGGFPGCGTFSAKTGEIPGELGWPFMQEREKLHYDGCGLAFRGWSQTFFSISSSPFSLLTLK